MGVITRNDGGEMSKFTYIPDFFSNDYYEKIKDWIQTLKYYKGFKKNGDKIDREQIWYDDRNNYFCKVWKDRQERWMPHKYDDVLKDIQEKINNRLEMNVDTCLVNKYNSGQDIIAAHKDNLISFGKYPNILIYSLGEKRVMQINSDVKGKTIKIELEPNSMFVMSGASQKYFSHELLKSDVKGVRWSLTFRKYLDHS